MVYLQKLHEKYEGKGLVVLGFNSADKRDIALKLIKKEKLTFPNVLNSSLHASQVALDKFRSNAVPTTYVIDRDGKILHAWVGFSPNDPDTHKALKLLKLE